MPETSPAIVWLRYDLRVSDNPALSLAVKSGKPVLPIYIYDTVADRPMGSASRWWLHHSLTSLRKDLKNCGFDLRILQGDPELVLNALVKETNASYVTWNRRYDGYGIEKDKSIKNMLALEDVVAESFNGNLLSEPWVRKTGSGGYYKVFTPYWKSCLREDPPSRPLKAPKAKNDLKCDIEGISIESLNLLPKNPDWSEGFSERFTPGSAGAVKKLNRFLNQAVEEYADERNRADKYGTSRLSPHLAFGEISPRQIWHKTKDKGKESAVFLSEIGWREFSYVLLFHNPNLASQNFKSYFDAFEWAKDDDALRAWQKGMTGYPYVDAGMRELWTTGWQHNRVRMVTASFLIKHLLQDWRKGEEWFWDTLVDADPASNAASWQWVAGSGADASPYFRIFNPFSQGKKFDPEGDYVRQWVPELAGLPKKYIHTPWEAPKDVLASAGVNLGETYPKPIVDHATARARALAAYKATRE